MQKTDRAARSNKNWDNCQGRIKLKASIGGLLQLICLVVILPGVGYALNAAQFPDKAKESVVAINAPDSQGQLIRAAGGGIVLPSDKAATNGRVVETAFSSRAGHDPASMRLSHMEWARRAMDLKTTKDWQGMLDWCRQWTKSEPKSPDVWFNLGIAYGNLGRYNEAVAAYRQAVMTEPAHSDAWYGMGTAYDGLKRYNPAIEAYHQAVMVDPENASAWYGMGVACSRLERYDEAIEAYHQAVTLDPKYASAWFGIGVAYLLSGSEAEPMAAVQELRRLDLAQADRLFNLISPTLTRQAWEDRNRR